jgi:hypothetical protein
VQLWDVNTCSHTSTCTVITSDNQQTATQHPAAVGRLQTSLGWVVFKPSVETPSTAVQLPVTQSDFKVCQVTYISTHAFANSCQRLPLPTRYSVKLCWSNPVTLQP